MTFKNMYRVLVPALLFLTPIIYTAATNEAFEFNKVFFVFFIGLSMVFVFLLECFLKPFKGGFLAPSIILGPKPVAVAVGAFAMANIIATVFSMHLYTSVWWYYNRFSDGLFFTLILIAIFIILITRFTKQELRGYYFLIIATVIPVSAVAIYQHFTLNEGVRVYSTIGQANWLAAYLAMSLMATLYFFLCEDNNSKKLAFGITFLLGGAGLWYTYSLSGFVGFVTGIVVFTTLNYKLILNQKKLVGMLFFAFIVLFGLTAGIFPQRVRDIFIDVSKLTKQGAAQVKPTAAAQISDPTYIRFGVWQGTLALIFSSPKVFLVGTGPETFPYAFGQFRPQILNFSSEWGFIINKPHNYYLEVFAETGLVGFLAYLWLVFISLKKRHAFITPAMVVFHVTNFFGFPTSVVWVLFWFGLATLYAPSSVIKDKFAQTSIKKLHLKKIFLTSIIFVAYLGALLNIAKLYLADVNYKNSQKFLHQLQVTKALQSAQTAIKLNPNESAYYLQNARVRLVANQKEGVLKNLLAAEDLNPSDMATKLDGVVLYFYLATNAFVKNEHDTLEVDKNYVRITKDFFNKIKQNYPENVGALVKVAKYEKLLFVDDFEVTKQLIKNLRPAMLKWHGDLL